MKLSAMIKRLPTWYLAGIDQSKPDRVRCHYVTSAPGRGKTTVLAGAAKMLTEKLDKPIGVVILNGPLLTPSDSVGYLVPKHMEDGTAESIYTDPFWFRTTEGKRLNDYWGGIIVVDEADKMDTDVKKVIGEAALSGRLGPHALPDNWVVWMAGNRAKDRSGSTKELDHLINRRMEHEVTDDIESWTDWATANGVSPLTIAFTVANPQIVFSEGVPDKQGPWATPRSVVMADSYMQELAKDNGGVVPIEDSLVTEELGGMVGHGAAAQMVAFCRLEREMPKFERIVADPKGVKVPEKPDAQMLVCYTLASRVDEKTAAPVIAYVERMPKEFAVTFATAAARRDFKLVATPAFNTWCMANASLMAAIAR